ncbi:MAG: glycosyltransferase family 1 protein [bacterium]
MKVCIDIQAAIAQRAGVGRYTKALVEHLGALAGDDELALFYFDFQRKGTPFPVAGAGQKAVRWCPGRVVQKAWKEIGWPPFDWLAGPADVYHFPNFILPPLTRGKSVVTIHDTSFLRHPETTEEKNLRYLNAKIRDTVRRADAIITDSVFSAMEIETLLKAPREKLHPVLLGLPGDLRRPAGEAVREVRSRHSLARPYLLLVGTLEPRKNVPFLVEVFEKLGGFDGDLVIAGMRGWKYEPILQRMQVSPRRERIRYLEYVDEEDLPALYAGAELFVFPSFYEGFGFTPLEAMACGTPVIASSAGSLPEVLGGAAELVEAFDTDEWTARVGALLADRGRCEQLRVRGLEHVKRFDWNETARKTWNVYRGVV